MVVARVARAAPLLAGAVAACGADAAPSRQLSVEAQKGEAVARRAGCAGCHGGADGGATIGPSWVGLWGTGVTLDDGTVVEFDEQFVRTAVRDPDAQRPEGTWLHMPAFSERQVSEADLQALIVYLRELGPSS